MIHAIFVAFGVIATLFLASASVGGALDYDKESPDAAEEKRIIVGIAAVALFIGMLTYYAAGGGV